jgi:hypothetical protein
LLLRRFQVNKDGGSAFPINYVAGPNGDPVSYASDGMTLRDYAAIHADVSTGDFSEVYKNSQGRYPTVIELADYMAEIRYIMADAMLRARDK